MSRGGPCIEEARQREEHEGMESATQEQGANCRITEYIFDIVIYKDRPILIISVDEKQMEC